jgi:acetoin utilization protein AcuB
VTFVWYTSESKAAYSPQVQATPIFKGVEKVSSVHSTTASNPVTIHQPNYEDAAHLPHQFKHNPYGQYKSDENKILTAQDIMSSPVQTMKSSSSIESAWALVTDKRFRHIPVVNDQNKPIGVISDRDLLRDKSKETRAKKISDIMKPKLLTAKKETPIRQIALILFSEKIGSMPIVDEKDNLIGIITRSDILRAVVQFSALELRI